MSKPRIMYIVESYPAITETYIQSEIDALRDDYEISVLAHHQAEYVNLNHHECFEVRDPACMLEAAKKFKPDALHTHWLVHVPLVGNLAAQLGVPFTVRAHSFDGVWQDSESTPANASEIVRLINSDLCLSVLGFPFMRTNFERAGIASQKILDSYPCMNFERFYDQGLNGFAVISGGAPRNAKQMEDLATLAAAAPELELNLYTTVR